MGYDVVEARHAGGHALDLTFEDGRKGRVDLGSYAQKGGVFARFSDLEYFRRFELNPGLGTLCWPDGVDIAPETLYALATGRQPVAS